jgi:hypothetical protein
VFENRVLRKIFGPKRDEETREWNEELNGLYSSPNIVRVIKSRMRWAGQRGLYSVLVWGNLRERGQLGDPGVDENILFRWIFRIWDVGVWNGSSWLRIGIGGGNL